MQHNHTATTWAAEATWVARAQGCRRRRRARQGRIPASAGLLATTALRTHVAPKEGTA